MPGQMDVLSHWEWDYSITMFWLLSLLKTMIRKDRMLEMEAGFSVLLWQSQDIPIDFNPE